METFEYKLQKFDPGVVLLDADNRIVAMNQIAHRVLGNIGGNPIGRDVLQLHPEKSKEKIQLLLRSGSEAGGGPIESSPPMTMMINIPDRVLLIKVTRLSDGSQDHGSCMMFYDLTDITTSEPGAKTGREGRPKQLVKIPVLLRNRVVLLAMTDVVHLQADGHYTRIFTFDQDHFCNLSLTDLEQRLNQEQFMRTHRSHVVNLQHVRTVDRRGEQYRLVLDTKDQAHVPISRNRVDEIRQYFGLS
jgi:hypothetical protein